MRSISRKTWLLWTVGVSAIAVFLTLTWPHEKLLLSISHKVGQESDSWNCVYLPTEEAFVFRQTSHMRDAFHRDVAEDIALYDLATGVERPLPALAHWYNSLPRPFNFARVGSPDGQWLLLWQSTNFLRGCAVVSRNGTQHFEYWRKDFKDFNECEGSWLNDGQHWAEIVLAGKTPRSLLALIHDVRRPQAPPEKVVFPIPKEYGSTSGELHVVSNTCLIGMDWYPYQPTSVSIFRSNRTATGASTQYYHIPVPSGWKVRGIVLSPDGKMLSWRCTFSNNSVVKKWLSFLPFLKTEDRLAEGIWISNLDGSRMREVGHILRTPDEYDPPMTDQVWWSPDSKHLYFNVKGTIRSTKIPE